MRTVKDRLRHTLLFEAIALAIISPAGALIFDLPLASMGILSVFASLVATVWNYTFNYGFDHALHRLTGSAEKSLPLRIIHAVAFEAGMLAIMLPVVAWYLSISLYKAFMMDILIAVFFMVYAFIFNYVYDRIYPISAGRMKTQSQPPGAGPEQEFPQSARPAQANDARSGPGIQKSNDSYQNI